MPQSVDLSGVYEGDDSNISSSDEESGHFSALGAWAKKLTKELTKSKPLSNDDAEYDSDDEYISDGEVKELKVRINIEPDLTSQQHNADNKQEVVSSDSEVDEDDVVEAAPISKRRRGRYRVRRKGKHTAAGRARTRVKKALSKDELALAQIQLTKCCCQKRDFKFTEEELVTARQEHAGKTFRECQNWLLPIMSHLPIDQKELAVNGTTICTKCFTAFYALRVCLCLFYYIHAYFSLCLIY